MEIELDLAGDRVRKNTAEPINRRIDEATRVRVRRYADDSGPAIDARIRQLNREWDVERVLETNASLVALSGLVLGATVNRKWHLLSAAVLGFLLLHGTQGWCPPLPVLRRLGVRTQPEIDREKFSLQSLRPGPVDERSSGPERRRLSALVE